MAPNPELIQNTIEATRGELLDMSRRNRLLSYRLLSAQGVEIVQSDPKKILQAMVTNGRSLLIAPRPQSQNAPLLSEEFGVDRSLERTSGSTRLQLQTDETPTDLSKRLLNTYRIARTSLEETGVNMLFLAIGMLQWYESNDSNDLRLAPLTLVPVRLNREGATTRFRLEYDGEDIGVNQSLIEFLQRDFRVSLPGQDELDSDDGKELDIPSYINKVEKKIDQSSLPRWAVDRHRLALGFFSFHKLLMWHDLEDAVWREAGSPILANQIIAALFGDGFHEGPSGIPDEERLDVSLPPAKTHHVLDADSYQSLAIYDAANGRNMVIQGPPGTGKSQTIANILAEAVANGKRVLFVAEKMAALEVVKRRMDNIGLGQVCLELHSDKANKIQVLEELRRTLRGLAERRERLEPSLQELEAARKRLNDYAQQINTPIGDTGVSLHDAIGQLLLLGDTGPNPLRWQSFQGIRRWSRQDFTRKQRQVEELQLRLGDVGLPSQHPFYGVGLREWTPNIEQDLADDLDTADRSVMELAEAAAALADALPPMTRPTTANEAQALLAMARLAEEAPDLGGLDLAVPQWRTHPDQINRLLRNGLRRQSIHAEFDNTLHPDAWGTDFSEVRHVLNTTGRNFVGRLFSFCYKHARRQLTQALQGRFPQDVDEQVNLLDTIAEEAQLSESILSDGAAVSEVLSGEWAGLQTNWDALEPPIRWWMECAAGASDEFISALKRRAQGDTVPSLANSITELSDALTTYTIQYKKALAAFQWDKTSPHSDLSKASSESFSDHRELLQYWSARLPTINAIVQFSAAGDELIEAGLNAVVDLAETHLDAETALSLWFTRAWYEFILDTALNTHRELQTFNRNVHESTIRSFRELDQRMVQYNRSRVALVHRQGIPTRTPLFNQRTQVRRQTFRSSEQLSILERELEKKQRHKPIRRLLSEAGDVIQDLKPVFMMSPLSIAKFLAPGKRTFDLVVFDEASQVRPADALGALLRAEKAVVVGDSKQLPPTTFFDRMLNADDEDNEDDDVISSPTEDLESILGFFSIKNAPSRPLNFHYRSRHESLIAVSNHEFYQNCLVALPSPDAGKEDTGLEYRYLPDTAYDRGGSRTNPKEAEAVAHAVMDHAKAHPNLSLGVAAFSSAQARAIEDRVEALRRQDPSAEDFFNAHPEEPFFVKNLENVQGDERDVVFISIGYGKDANGRMTQNFGPLNRDGGQRRLNVLITRAKHRCIVFTNLHESDVEAANEGTKALKTFLAYAESGQMPTIAKASEREVDSPFQQAVAQSLEARGYSLRQEVGVGGYFIDIGIIDPEHPGRYVIGIECDGASYHSSKTARDRDRIREAHLRSLGWELHRIWSTDWWNNPQRELNRCVEAIERVLQRA